LWKTPLYKHFFGVYLWITMWKVWMDAVFMHCIYGDGYKFSAAKGMRRRGG